MESNIQNSNIYNRLRELRVDFAFSKNLFFAASNRVSKEEKVINSTKNKLEISSILISVITLSSVAFYFSQVVIGLLSILAIGISLYLLTLKNKNTSEEYIKTANGYLDLYKKAKIIEAKVKDNIIGMVELSERVEELTHLQSKLNNSKLQTNESDFEIAKENIKKGSNTYTETDFDNT